MLSITLVPSCTVSKIRRLKGPKLELLPSHLTPSFGENLVEFLDEPYSTKNIDSRNYLKVILTCVVLTEHQRMTVANIALA